jgi:hypothetical protein
MVKFPEVFFTGKADHLLRSFKINTDVLPWSEFSILISNGFVAETTYELIDSFRHLEQGSSFTAYIDTFEELMDKLTMKDPTLIEAYFVANFISGLKDHIKVHLKSHNPTTLVQAYSLARNYESSRQKQNLLSASKWPPRSYQPRMQQNPVKKEMSKDKHQVTNRWEKEKCFKCQEPWTPGHNRVCKFRNQIHWIAKEHDDECLGQELAEMNATETQEEEPELQISKAQTFPLFVYIGDVKVVTLIDSGSTTIFLDPSVIEKVGLLVSHTTPEKITVANDGTLWTAGMTSATPYTIQGHQFLSNFRVLELSGYDMILGCDWIYDNNPVGINLKSR